MAIDAWKVSIEPNRALRRDIVAFRNGAKSDSNELADKINDLQYQVSELTKAINTLVGMIKREVQNPAKKRELPPPPFPQDRTLPRL